MDNTDLEKQAEEQIGAFVDGVEAACKEAQLDHDIHAEVWALVGYALEKQAATPLLALNPNQMMPSAMPIEGERAISTVEKYLPRLGRKGLAGAGLLAASVAGSPLGRGVEKMTRPEYGPSEGELAQILAHGDTARSARLAHEASTKAGPADAEPAGVKVPAAGQAGNLARTGLMGAGIGAGVGGIGGLLAALVQGSKKKVNPRTGLEETEDAPYLRNALVGAAGGALAGGGGAPAVQYLAGKFGKPAEAFTAELDSFVDGVIEQCKQANLSADDEMSVWIRLANRIEKQAADIEAPNSVIPEVKDTLIGAPEPGVETPAVPRGALDKLKVPEQPAVSSAPTGEQMYAEQMRQAQEKAEVPPVIQNQATPTILGAGEPLDQSVKGTPTPETMMAAPPAQPPAAKAPWYKNVMGMDWSDPKVWGKGLLLAGGAGLLSLLYGAISSGDERKKHTARNLVMSSLVAGLAGPYALKYMGSILGGLSKAPPPAGAAPAAVTPA